MRGSLFAIVLFVSMASYASWRSFLFLEENETEEQLDESKEKLDTKSLLSDDEDEDDEDTPVSFGSPILDLDQLESRPWQKTDFSEQSALGYGDGEGFRPPTGLETQVIFWKDIYTKYSSWQGVIHDADHIDHIFAEVDFTPIMTDNSLSDGQKKKARRALVKRKKKEYRDLLLKLDKTKDPSRLSAEEKKVWDWYADVDERRKFYRASRRGRLRFQLGQSDYFQQGIYQSGRYIETMTEIFKENEVPIELIRLVFVESSFNLKARSKVGASGIWQFMRSTGRQYMRVNNTVDERNDPIRATKAAAKKFRYNYKKVGNWPLAITGYNYGPAGIARLAKKYKSDDIVYLINNAKSRRWGFASKNFYASFLAALEVERNADKYFKDPKWAPRLEFEIIKLERSIGYKQLLDLFGGDKELLDLYNPHFGYNVIKGYSAVPKRYTIRVPKKDYQEILATMQELPKPKVSGVSKYKVNRGDTLSSIARTFGISQRKIMEANNLSSPHRIYVGQVLRVPR